MRATAPSCSSSRARRGPVRGGRAGRAACAAVAFAGVLALAACDAAHRTPDALADLERLAFVPSGQHQVLGDVPLYGNPEPLLVDRFEVTRAQWRAFLAAEPGGAAAVQVARARGWPEGTDAWPADFMTLAEAEAFAARRGMRLPTASEWLFCALGTGRMFPWGETQHDSVTNTLELGLGRPTAVGTYEGGRTPQGCFDMLGNVAEWVTDAPRGPERLPGDERVAALGGSFRTWRPVLVRQGGIEARVLHPGSRSDDVGLRCVTPAREYLWANAGHWGGGPKVETRLVALGERWGRRALPLLRDLAARPGAPPGLAALARGAGR